MGVRRARNLMVAVLVSLFVPATIGGTATAGAATPYKIAVYTTIGSAHPGLVGHMFVQLRHGRMNLIFGKYPGGRWLFNTDGKIKNDGDRTWSYRITYTVSAGEWSKAEEYVARQQTHPDNYRFLSDNCAQFAVHAAEKASLTVPDYKDFVGVPEPRVFYASLQKIGDGHTSHGGLVKKNPDPSQTASGAPDPPSSTPPCCDVGGVLSQALTNPRQLARDLRVSYLRHRLHPGSIAGNGNFRVVIKHTNIHDDVYAIRWGDGSHTFGEKPRTSGPGQVVFRHHYARAPSQPLQVVILQNGRVLDYNEPLTPTGAGSHSEVDVEPAPPPQRPYP